MKFYLKEKILTWFDSYNIYDENDNIAYIVKGELSWGHQVRIYDKNNKEIGLIKEKIFNLLPKFILYDANGNEIGTIDKQLTFFKHKYTLSCNDWTVSGDFFGWDYEVTDSNDQVIMTASKELLRFTDNYEINVLNKKNSLLSIMIVLAIDLEKCGNNRNN